MLKNKKKEMKDKENIPFNADVDVQEDPDNRWVDEGGSLTTLEQKENDS